MTIMSSGGLQFGILEIIASFGNVWADQSYWQASPEILPSRKFYCRLRGFKLRATHVTVVEILSGKT